MSASDTHARPDFPALIPLGTTHQSSLVVTHGLTVQATVPELPPVYATPHMIMAMEIACTDLLAGFLPPGWVSVGAVVDVKHLAATPEGFTVTVTARVVEATGSLVTFEVEAHDGVDLVGKGRHSRAPIQTERFMAGVARKQTLKP